jgi:hypothetical protein
VRRDEEEIMKRAFFNVAALILAVYAGAGLVTNSQTRNKPAPADIKIRQRMSMGTGGGAETLLYIKGQRMRSEMPGNLGFTNILQCDLKRTITINEKTKTYMITPTDGTAGSTSATAGDGGAAAMPPPTPLRGALVAITNTITETG